MRLSMPVGSDLCGSEQTTLTQEDLLACQGW